MEFLFYLFLAFLALACLLVLVMSLWACGILLLGSVAIAFLVKWIYVSALDIRGKARVAKRDSAGGLGVAVPEAWLHGHATASCLFCILSGALTAWFLHALIGLNLAPEYRSGMILPTEATQSLTALLGALGAIPACVWPSVHLMAHQTLIADVRAVEDIATRIAQEQDRVINLMDDLGAAP